MITLILRFRSGRLRPSVCPSMRISPSVGRSRVESRLIVVVFPAPLGPSRPKNSPVSMRRSRESTAVKLSNFFVRFFVSIISVHFLSFVCKFHSIILEKKRHFNNSEMFFTQKQKSVAADDGKFYGNAAVPAGAGRDF